VVSSHHPVLQKVLKLVEKNLFNPPIYISSLDKDISLITDRTTANPLTYAYYLGANKNGNIDVLYPISIIVEAGDGNPELNKQKQDSPYLCPDLELMQDLKGYILNNGISGASSLDIGHDTKGGTWIDEI
jgi:hypothetical protein